MKRAAIYARVSTDEQAERGYSLQDQVEVCREYAEFNSLNVVVEIKDDCSGAKLERPGLDELRDMVDRNEVDSVIIYTDDRLSRNLVHFLILREEWQSAGCELHLVTRGKSEDTAEGRLTERIHAVIAEFEREKIRERTRRGRLAKAKQGNPVLMGNMPFGYDKEGQGRESKMIRKEEELEIVQMIFEWYTRGDGSNGGLSQREIARRLNDSGMPSPTNGTPWSNIAIHRILNNEIYAGMAHYGKTRIINGDRVKQPRNEWIEIPVPELACIDEEVYKAAQKQNKRNRKRKYLMSGYFRCGTCEQVMVGHFRQGYTRYQCTTHWATPHKQPCPIANRSVATNKVDDAVWNWIKGLISDDESLDIGLNSMAARREGEIEKTRQELATVEKLLEKNQQTIQRLVDEMENYDDEMDDDDDIVLEVFRENISEASKRHKKMKAEQGKLLERIQRVEISEE